MLIFLSEPMLHQCDLHPLLGPFLGNYDAQLNSEDYHDQDLALDKVKARGGTMIMWHTSLTPLITVIPTESPSFQTILLKLPETVPSLHTALYLPTAGKEDLLFSTLNELISHFEEIQSKYPAAPPLYPRRCQQQPSQCQQVFFTSAPVFPSQEYLWSIQPITTLSEMGILSARLLSSFYMVKMYPSQWLT